MFQRTLPVLFFLAVTTIVAAQSTRPQFPVVDTRGHATDILVAAADAPVVRIAASAVATDIAGITGRQPRLLDTATPASTLIVAGTLSQSAPIEDLRSRGLLDTSAIAGKWESFLICVVDHPFPGVDRALVVAGSDPRGTAYGLFELSRRFGVSPWSWWADVPLPHRESLFLDSPEMTSRPPSVQYRGIFLNDEDFALRVWAGRTQDTELKNIGPKTYARVFELLLRLRANTLWPAMHPGSRTFNASPENARLAAQYAIVMGTSHAEPMMRNNVAEWDPKVSGAWDYEHNRDSLLHYWDERAVSNGSYENIYTVGMRGIHDNAMPGTGTPTEKARLLEKVLADQRAILAKRVNPHVEAVPQVFWMYKEVLELYQAGMNVPPDITLGWTDDNYGYIRELSNAQERARPGGSGVYYHVSYWGSPYDYLWLCTTPPELMREEMTKAYRYGAHKIWILNVGDLKPAEADIDYFLSLAWDEPSMEKLDQRTFLEQWSATQFPSAVAGKIAEVLDRFYQLNFERKPEFLGFNVDRAPVHRSAYNPIAFGDQNLTRREAFHELARKTQAIEAELPAPFRDAFFELVKYPVEAAAAMNDKLLLQDEAALASVQGRASTARLVEEANRAYEHIQTSTAEWNQIVNGKWNGMMSSTPHSATVFGPPGTFGGKLPAHGGLGIAVEGSATPIAGGDNSDRVAAGAGWLSPPFPSPSQLPEFERNAPGSMRFIDLFSTGQSAVSWSAQTVEPWIRLDASSGTLAPGEQHRLHVTLDWPLVPAGHPDGTVEIHSGETSYRITVSANMHEVSAGVFTENEGSISIPASAAKVVGARWKAAADLSPSGTALGIPDSPSLQSAALSADTSQLAFRFALATNVEAPVLDILTLPTIPATTERSGRYALSVDGEAPITVDAAASSAWASNVLRNSAVTTLKLKPLKQGEHTLHVWAIEPGVFFQHLVLHTALGPNAYPVPPSTLSLP